MPDPDLSTLSPREVLFSYFTAMLALTRSCMEESAANKVAGRPSLDAVALRGLRQRHAAICAAHFTNRKRTLVLGYGPAIADEYDVTHVAVKRELEESPRRVVLEIYNRARKERTRYALTAGKGGWRIGSVKKLCCTKCGRWLARML